MWLDYCYMKKCTKTNLHVMVVACVCLIEIWDKFDALADNEEEDNEDQDSCHVPFLPDILSRSWM